MGVAPQTAVNVQEGVAFAGMLGDDARLVDSLSYTNTEASAEMAFGLMVVQGTNAGEAKVPAANTDLPVGIVQHSHAYQKDNELGTTGLKPKVVFSALQRGRIWVTVDEAVALTDAVRVRMDAVGGTAGTFRKTAAAGHTKALTSSARWLTSTSGAGVALLEIDLNNRSGWTND